MTTAAPLEPDGWAAHREMQLRAHLATTPAQRLLWLEEAIRFALATGALVPRIDSERNEGT